MVLVSLATGAEPLEGELEEAFSVRG